MRRPPAARPPGYVTAGGGNAAPVGFGVPPCLCACVALACWGGNTYVRMCMSAVVAKGVARHLRCAPHDHGAAASPPLRGHRAPPMRTPRANSNSLSDHGRAAARTGTKGITISGWKVFCRTTAALSHICPAGETRGRLDAGGVPRGMPRVQDAFINS